MSTDPDDQVPPSKEVFDHKIQVAFREELDHLDDLVFIAEIVAILTGLIVVLAMVALAIILILYVKSY